MSRDLGAQFLARDRRKDGRQRAYPARRWIGSREWHQHSEECGDPYCSMIWSPYGECGVRVPFRRAEEILARRSARVIAHHYNTHPVLRCTGPVQPGMCGRVLPVAWRVGPIGVVK